MADKAGGSILRGIVDFGRFGVRQPVAFAGLIALLVGGMAGLGFSQAPSVGLDARVPIGAYLDGNFLPGAGDAMPARLSLTGAFGARPATPAEMQARIPHPGLVPYEINSALWTDAAIKERFIALPYGGTTGSPRIGFQPTGSWTYPAGTVIVKNFDMQLDEQTNTPATIRRLETRILVRNADGGVRGATYKWRADYTDADLVPSANTESLVIKGADGLNRSQPYLYPGPAECLRCHTENAGLMLGIKTAQLNGNFTYTTPNPPRIDNQLNTWERVGMFDQALLADLSAYDKMVDVMDTTATLEHRVRSYLSSNCAHCHMPGGEGPLFDMRYETSLLSPNQPYQSIIGARGSTWGGLIRDNLAASRIFVRDSSNAGGFGSGPMPPLARNVPDQRIIGPGALYEQWVNYPFDVLSVRANSRTQVRVQFDRPLDPVTAGNAANFVIDGGVTVSAAVPDTDPSAVLLTTSPLAYSTNYAVTVNRVRELAAPKNPIWPNTQAQFVSSPPPTVPGAPVIAVAGAGNAQVTLTVTPPATDGGSAITGYATSCSPGPVTASGTVMPVITISVGPLINGTQYSCTVRAINAIGASAASDPVLVTPFTVPGPPVIVSALPGNGSASITFTAPGSNGGAPITGYTASCLPGPVTAAGLASPILVTGLTNEQAYTCTIKASNAAGDSAPSSPPIAVTPTAAVPPVLLTVLSRKTHGSAGDFDIEINRSPTSAVLTVEPRGIGSGHRVVFQFDRAITAAGSVTVLDAAGAPIGSAAASVSGNNMTDVIVVLTGIPDNQRVTISLTGVNMVGVASVSMGFLVGDINDSRAVNAGDILAVKARPGPAVNGNFRFDLNASGSVDGRDLSMAKARAGLMLP